MLSGAFRCPNKATVFQAEVYAIYEAVQAVPRVHAVETITNLKFFVDSQAVLQALTAPRLSPE